MSSHKNYELMPSLMKEAYAHSCVSSCSFSSDDEEDSLSDSDFDIEQVMLETRSQAMKPRPNPKDCFLWEQKVETSDGEEYEGDDDKSQDFYSVEQHDEKSQGFYSVNSRFSRCSLSEKEFNHPNNFGAPSVLKEFGHCKGWPFGLSRRPPLLNCPSDSWIWRKRNLGSKMRASTFTSQRFAISHEMLQENTNRFK